MKYSTSGQEACLVPMHSSEVAFVRKVVRTRITLQITNWDHFCQQAIRNMLQYHLLNHTPMLIAIRHPRRAHRLRQRSIAYDVIPLETWSTFDPCMLFSALCKGYMLFYCYPIKRMCLIIWFYGTGACSVGQCVKSFGWKLSKGNGSSKKRGVVFDVGIVRGLS